jgi:hypothetical protein
MVAVSWVGGSVSSRRALGSIRVTTVAETHPRCSSANARARLFAKRLVIMTAHQTAG